MVKEYIRKVLILCAGNSCRSQMAEALINDKLSRYWKAYSAGTEPSDYIHPIALKVLNEVGIDHLGKSKHIDDLPTKEFDLVITVCEHARNNCPVWVGAGKRAHISIPDPVGVFGTQDEIMNTFRIIRDEIDAHILGYLKNLESME
ncbi:MAG: arsenate reductase ArsC [Anaerolineales bacterium]|nr:arsenate reductase ArsC [Anaerolineales bacterium]